MNLIVGKNDLATTHPALAKEADGWDPSQYSAGSSAKKLNWKCKLGHNWEAKISDRSKRSGTNCPFCTNQKVLTGFNDLATTHPDLATEADGWDPTDVIGSGYKKVNWKCKYGHLWQAAIYSRKTGNGCPTCAGKKILEGFNDLATTHPDIAKEADGWDPKRITAKSGKSKKWKCSLGHTWKTSVSHRTNGTGCPFCIGQKVQIGFNDLKTLNPKLANEAYEWDPSSTTVSSDRIENWQCKKGHIYKSAVKDRTKGNGCPICTNKKVLIGFNDLATTHPDLANEADGWDPKTVIAGTHKKLKWKCKQGHEWIAPGTGRRLGEGCPVCDNKKVLVGYNDLATTHPDLAKEAFEWDTKTVTSGSSAKRKWKCNKGHIWTAQISSRKLSGCPSCAPLGFDPNKSAFIYFLLQPIWELYQIGITNNIKERLKAHKRNGFDLLEFRGPMDGHTAQELESALLRYLKNQKADLSPEHIAGKFDGYSESWTIDSFKVNNLKELIDKASEVGY